MLILANLNLSTMVKHYLKFLMIALLFCTHELVAQTSTISGRVTGENNEGLPGVNILIKGTQSGTVTDLDGVYNLSVDSENAVLVFGSVGYITQEITVGNKTVIDINMAPDITSLDELVVIGYGSVESKDVTGAVGSVKSEDFNKGVVTSPGQLIQGKVSGVEVTSSSGAPGSGQRITIRGQGSIRQGTGPLFVVDGFPIGLAGTGSSESPLNFINPEDIESMDVLKDASATAIYGSRGANGVIIITTKKAKEGVSRISLSSSVGVSTLANKIPVFSADEFRRQVVAVGGILEDGGGNTDWQDELTQNGITNNHNVVFQGGADKFTYRASLGYFDQEGVVINSNFKRYSGRISATQKLMDDDRLKIDFNLSSTVEFFENPNTGQIVSEMLDFNPTFIARQPDGQPTNFPEFLNPLISAEIFNTHKELRRTLFNVTPSFEIIDGLVYKLNFGYDNISSDTDEQRIPSTDPFEEGRLQQDFFNGSNVLIENYLTYDFDIANDHQLSVLAGHSYQETRGRFRSWSIDRFPDNGIEPRYNPGLGQEIDLVDNSPTGSADVNELQSFFGRVNYTYRGKYMATATVRSDGSSKFGENNKYGTFPSFALGWRVSDEPFMENSPFGNLKLRLGWGQTGNQEIPGKITQQRFTTQISDKDSYPLGGQEPPYTAGTTFVRLANPDIQWEVSTQTNVGIDFDLFEGKLSGTVDYFHKVSDNILLEVVPADPIQPANEFWTNVEDMEITNKGWELALHYQSAPIGDFSYGIGANLTVIDNNVEGSPFTILTTGSASGSGLTGATINGLINGEPIGTFYMPVFVGIGPDSLSVFEESEDAGRQVVGHAIPDVMYNFNLNMSYKRFDLTANFNGVSGNDIYNNTAMNKFYKALLAKSFNTTSRAVEFPNESVINSSPVSTRYLEDGSFFRLNNLTLGYNFNLSAMGIDNWVQDMRLFFTGQNLFVITDYEGFDPEVNQDRSISDIQSHGIDLNGYPKARTFILGLNVSF